MLKKRLAVFAVFSALLATAALASGPSLSFKFYGGAGYWPTGGDFKELFESTAARWDYVGYTGTFDMDWKPMSVESGVQAILALTPRFGLAVGAGIIMKNLDQDADVQYLPAGTMDLVSSYKIRAVPLTLDAVYAVLDGPFRLVLSGGLGYYLTSMSFEAHGVYAEPTRPTQPNWAWDVRETYESETKGVLGFQFGLGAEFRLAGRIFLCLDAFYRLVSFDDLQGVYDWVGAATWDGGSSGSTYDQGQAKVWYSESTVWGQIWHYLDFSDDKPTTSDDARLFKFDLGGPVVRIGIRIGI